MNLSSQPSFAVFVSSTDSYSDCWEPFFTLFSYYWPDYEGTIYLNTETKDFQFPGLDIVCTQVARFAGTDTIISGKRIKLALQHVVKEEVILYINEDIFLHDRVQSDVMGSLVQCMHEHDLLYVGVTDHANHGPFRPSPYPLLWEIDGSDPYVFSAMPSLWNVKRMEQYFRAHEDPWQTEYYIARRIRKANDKTYTIDRTRFDYPAHAILPFAPTTGIYRGTWVADVVVDLFAEHGIKVDYSRRGFFDPTASYPPPFRPLWRKAVSVVRSMI
jgi:hypothetical protein